MDCRTPSEACCLPETPLQLGTVEDYREELVLSLLSARELAVASIRGLKSVLQEELRPQGEGGAMEERRLGPGVLSSRGDREEQEAIVAMAWPQSDRVNR